MTPLRADAQRNLTRVLDAAADAFAEHGPDVSVDEIARRAGVGHATVFRRFPTKEALVAAVVEDHVAALLALAHAALDEDDAAAAFTGFVWQAAELHASRRGLFECAGRCGESPGSAELAKAVELIALRARAAGALRDDIAGKDVYTLVGAAIESAPSEQWRRYVDVVLAGLRPS
jgi:AcrR family transcriptional regulator